MNHALFFGYLSLFSGIVAAATFAAAIFSLASGNGSGGVYWLLVGAVNAAASVQFRRWASSARG